ncbi:MAG TPA: SDR family oxidoreductase, partial [Allosphingosinicella sp.]|nr:SDR family oxidoreductase [Allosphingosinicella sp.]
TAAETIVGEGGRCLAVTADLDDQSAREQLVRQANDTFGKIDIAVLNTRGPSTGNLRQLGLAEWDQAYQSMIRPVVDLINRLAPAMSEQGWGRLLTITSFATKSPVDELGLSGSLRGALTGLMRVLANELGPSGVTANSILPGYTETERVRAVIASQANSAGTSAEEESARIARNIPVGRIATPEEFAAVAAFLVSGPAGYINGQAIVVDGGLIRTII